MMLRFLILDLSEHCDVKLKLRSSWQVLQVHCMMYAIPGLAQYFLAQLQQHIS